MDKVLNVQTGAITGIPKDKEKVKKVSKILINGVENDEFKQTKENSCHHSDWIFRAGKTTLLNRILTEKHHQKIAVIVNEYGEVGIDNQLVVNSDEEILEMNNGCICCTVRGDLIRILRTLMFSMEQGKVKFDRVLIETTGLADPAPVAQTFFMDEITILKHLK